MKKLWVAKFVLIIGTLTSSPTSAQSPGTFGPGYNPGYAMNMDVAMGGARGGGGSTICGQSYSDDNEKARLLAMQAAGKCGGSNRNAFSNPGPASRMSAAAPNGSALTFKPAKARTEANLRNFVNKTRAVDPDGAARMEQMFASSDVIGEIGGVMSRFGLSKNNAADAFALYWIAAWQAVHGDSSTPTTAMSKAVAAQAARGLSISPQYGAATEAQKQEMAEALMVQAALIEASVEQAGSDRTQLRAISNAVAKGAEASGLELDTMTLTQEGFVEGGPRKTGDASDMNGDEDTAMAAAQPADGAGVSSTQMALIAAAGGAGLAGVFLFGRAMGRKG